jgi:hypothetical protein
MNHLFWPTGLLAALLFWIGSGIEKTLNSRPQRLAFIVIATALALPGLLFAAYYTKLLGEPIWLYRFRAAPGTELTAAGVGLLAGFAHQARHKHALLRKQLRSLTIPAILAVIISAPYLKPLIRPVKQSQLTEQWRDGVCLQSTPSTCGPASAATIVKSLGKTVTEAELARESLTYAGGTENWYLVRALRQRGFHVEFQPTLPDAPEFPTPAIAGVKLPQGTGHFIALLSQADSNYVGSDPLTGRFTATLAELKMNYQFTGFFLVIR